MTKNGLSSSGAQAELLIKSIKDYAIYMLDCDGIVRSWNPGAERLKGYKTEEIIGRHFSTFYTEEDRSRNLPDRALQTAREDGQFEAEGWRVRKDGSRFWANAVIEPILDEDGRHIGFAKSTRDLSERRAAELALRESEERFRLLVQGVTDYAIYMLDPEGRVSSWNAGAERFKGYKSDEIIGQHFSRFYTSSDLEAGIPTSALEIAKTEGRFEAEGWRVRKDGSRFWASVVIDPIRSDDGELKGFTKITRDLTERKMAQEELDVSREQFFQSQKMEAIGQLTGGVAHDFNNILAAILSSIRLARRRIDKGEDANDFLTNAAHAAERGATLTQRMLAFARKQELKLEAVDLKASVTDMTDLLQRTIGPNIAIQRDFPRHLPHVTADSAQIELAIMNLVVNARDAMPNGGDIIISASEFEPEEGGETLVKLSVKDTGEGMDADTQARAMDPFFTTKGVGKGTGLGLSMVRGMAEQCGGHFSLESTPGEGTTANIVLRIAQEEQSAARGETVAPEPSTNSLTILAVDDDGIILLNTATILEEMGHKVFEASSGAAALEILGREKVDLMITDYAMPRMTGADLAVKAREQLPDLKIIVASGYAEMPDGLARNLPRLSKPYSDEELASAIDALCG
ncbi:PAS domain S-box protein [Qipengyuania sp. XHP0211]|uniref:hybrid sensor histidine kinase/response regulator n=1 Tax=Qipengyuania sp. XHP0211 TaxID=3038079 RepID=UPI00241C6799|nr:PAS domain-containing sensor histidine kinase [Qipengyuania sp. XHP0211]MDG5749550.1 PAS domain S-box protein [Qipengyuania sp. XHP0211]